MISTDKAADLLLQARVKHKPIPNLPESCRPKDILTAYECQNVLTNKMLKMFGGERIGYKVACTNKTAQTLVNMDSPFYGPLLSPFVFESSAKLHLNDFLMRVVEPEFGFVMAAALPARSTLYEKEEVFKAIEAVVPAIEVVDSRYEDWTEVGGPSLIADNACNAAWIYGQPVKDWCKFDLPNHAVDLYVNGVPTRKGSGCMVLDNPLNVVTWLANTLSEHGKGLQAGDLISTGIVCDVYMGRPGDKITADFGPIGSVEFSFIG